MLDDSTLGHEVWDYAAEYAAVVSMKTTTSKAGLSTWSLYTGREPNIKSIAKFGAPCFVHILLQTRLKARLDELKMVEGRVIGQCDDISGWIVKVDSTGEIHRSRDVRMIHVPAQPSSLPTMMMVPKNRPTDVEVLTEGLASGPLGYHQRATTNQAAGVDVPSPPDTFEEVDGDSLIGGVVRLCRGNGMAPSTPAPATVSDHFHTPSPKSDSADPPPIVQRVRRSATWELMPEKTVDGAPLPPASYTDDAGRRVMTRRAPGRSLPSAERAMAIEAEAASLATHDGEDAEAVDSALATGWMLSISIDDDEPPSVAAALSGPHGSKWLAALETELHNLESKGTWTEVKRPEDRAFIEYRRVLKVKRDALGEIIKFKARLVAQGLSQVPGVDFE